MRIARLSSLLVLAALASCSDASNPPPASSTSDPLRCQQALERLDSCAAEYCAQHEDRTCETLSQGREGSLFSEDDDACQSMTDAEITHLLSASCDQMVLEAKLLASGKADFPCPSYFPWCNALAPGNAGYRVNLLSFDSQSAELEVILPDVGRSKVVREGQTYQSLHLAGAGLTRNVGRPAVPAVSFLIGVPDGIDTAWVESFEPLEQAGVERINLIPYEPPVLEDAPPPAFEIDTDFYAKDALYPGVDYELDPVATWRNYRVVRVTVHPFQYNPAQKHLAVTTRLKLRLRFDDQFGEPRDTVIDGESTFEGAYGGTLVNYPEISGGNSGTPPRDDPERTRYLIIAHDPYIEALAPLVELKHSQQMQTEVVALSTLGAEPVKIKERIAQAYQDSAIEYVLLVGNETDLPMYRFPADPNNYYSEETPSDYWYGLLAGDDLFAEVSVGRLSGANAEEIATQVAKIVAYAQGDIHEAWRKKILLVAHEEQYPGKYTACHESVRTAQYKPGPIDFVRMYGGEGATTEQLVQTINEGTGIIIYRGHGSEVAWWEWNGEDFAPSKAALANGPLTPVVLSIACLNSALQYHEPSAAEQWMLHPGGGAVAFLGATLPSWTKPNDDFDRHLMKTLLNEGVTAIGPMVDRARAALLTQYGSDTYSSDNVKMYLWLGDPSTEIGQAYKAAVPVSKIGWCNLQHPESLTLPAGAESELVFGQVWSSGVTEPVGQGEGIEAQLGFGPAQTDPSAEGWVWVEASYNVDVGNNDEYSARLLAPEAGSYSYAYRFRGAGEQDWVYCDKDGSHNGLDTAQLGVLTAQ